MIGFLCALDMNARISCTQGLSFLFCLWFFFRADHIVMGLGREASFHLGPPHSPHPHTLKKPRPVHMLGSVPWTIIYFLRISTKFPDSKTCETLKIEALLPEASVEQTLG